jgi:hypothetical protein
MLAENAARNHEIEKRKVSFGRNLFLVRECVIGTAHEDPLRSQRQLCAVQNLFMGTD